MSRKIAQGSVLLEEGIGQASCLDQNKQINFKSERYFYIYLIILPLMLSLFFFFKVRMFGFLKISTDDSFKPYFF